MARMREASVDVKRRPIAKEDSKISRMQPLAFCCGRVVVSVTRGHGTCLIPPPGGRDVSARPLNTGSCSQTLKTTTWCQKCVEVYFATRVLFASLIDRELDFW
jgi:hypothetical protein